MRTLTALIVLLFALPAGAQQLTAPPITTEDRADVARVEAHLNGITTMKAKFVQIGPRGEIAEGTFYLSRPGRMRFEYDPPAKILVLADGLRVIYYDKELDHENAWPIGGTPLAPLLARRIEFNPNSVIAVARQSGSLRITLIDPQRRDEGSLTLVFTDGPLELRQWTVLDTQGLSTVIALSSMEINPTVDPDLFFAPERRER